MLFQFQLQLLEEVEPWGGQKPTLHWFGLTDGWYWWNVSTQELFRYSHANMCTWTNEFAEFHSASPYVNYQVVRPWEDLLQCLPAVLDPVPDDLILRTQDEEKWQNLLDRAGTWIEGREDDASWDLLENKRSSLVD